MHCAHTCNTLVLFVFADTSFNDDSWVLHGKTKCAMKTYETTKNGPHHQGKKIEITGTCVAHGKRQDTKASHMMANGLIHQKSRKAKIELD